MYFSTQKQISLQVQIKIGEYEVIENKKYKIIAIKFISEQKVDIDTSVLEQKAIKANANIFINQNSLLLELPII